MDSWLTKSADFPGADLRKQPQATAAVGRESISRFRMSDRLRTQRNPADPKQLKSTICLGRTLVNERRASRSHAPSSYGCCRLRGADGLEVESLVHPGRQPAPGMQVIMVHHNKSPRSAEDEDRRPNRGQGWPQLAAAGDWSLALTIATGGSAGCLPHVSTHLESGQ